MSDDNQEPEQSADDALEGDRFDTFKQEKLAEDNAPPAAPPSADSATLPLNDHPDDDTDMDETEEYQEG